MYILCFLYKFISQKFTDLFCINGLIFLLRPEYTEEEAQDESVLDEQADEQILGETNCIDLFYNICFIIC